MLNYYSSVMHRLSRLPLRQLHQSCRSASSTSSPALVLVTPVHPAVPSITANVAAQLGGEVVVVDQWHLCSDLAGTHPKPTEQSTSTVPHHLLDISSSDEVQESLSELVTQAVEDVRARGKLPVLAGSGTTRIPLDFEKHFVYVCPSAVEVAHAIDKHMDDRILEGNMLLEAFRLLEVTDAAHLLTGPYSSCCAFIEHLTDKRRYHSRSSSQLDLLKYIEAAKKSLRDAHKSTFSMPHKRLNHSVSVAAGTSDEELHDSVMFAFENPSIGLPATDLAEFRADLMYASQDLFEARQPSQRTRNKLVLRLVEVATAIKENDPDMDDALSALINRLEPEDDKPVQRKVAGKRRRTGKYGVQARRNAVHE